MRLEDIDIFIGMERIRVGTTARIGAAVTAPTDIDCSRAERGEPGGQATSERDERKKFERAASSSSNQWTGVVDGARTAGRRQATSYRRPLSVHTIHSAAAAAAWGAPGGCGDQNLRHVTPSRRDRIVRRTSTKRTRPHDTHSSAAGPPCRPARPATRSFGPIFSPPSTDRRRPTIGHARSADTSALGSPSASVSRPAEHYIVDAACSGLVVESRTRN